MADQKKLAAPKPPKADEIPKYIIRESVFLNHRYIMAGPSDPVVIQTVTRPNIKWEPLNDAACTMLEKMCERQVKHSKGDVPTSSHLAAMTLKRTIAKYRGEPIPEDEFLDEEPQDSAGFAPVVRQPADPARALREAGPPRVVNMDGVPTKGMAAPLTDLTGEPPADDVPSEESPAEEPPAEEAPAEEAPPEDVPTSDESQVPQGDLNANTLRGQQVRPRTVRRPPPTK